MPSVAEIWACLAEIPDPEIPVISILDLGIVRDVAWRDEGTECVLQIAVTPTYSGCPAIRAIERDIVDAMHARGIAHVQLEIRLHPPWTTDWMTAPGREKLRAYGISPPRARIAPANGALDLSDLLEATDERAECPRCGSRSVVLVSRFGSTPCKAHYRCNACREPFDHFKTH